MYFNELDMPGGGFIEVIAFLFLLFWLGKSLLSSLVQSIFARDWASLKFFICAAAMLAIIILDKPKWDFLVKIAWFAGIAILLYKGCITGCNKQKKRASSNALDNPPDQLADNAYGRTMTIIACPSCNLRLRVPDNTHIIATCPKCKNSFEYGV